MNYTMDKQQMYQLSNTTPANINGNYPQNISTGIAQMTLNDNDPSKPGMSMPTKQIYSSNRLINENDMILNSHPGAAPPMNFPNQMQSQQITPVVPYRQNMPSVPTQYNYVGNPPAPMNSALQNQILPPQNNIGGDMVPPLPQQGYNNSPLGMPPPMNYPLNQGNIPTNNMRNRNIQNPMYNTAPLGNQPPAMQRRLDPDQMPNPIQVMIENQKTCEGIFSTSQPGLLPPLVTTKFVTVDQGNSNPRFVRSSLYCIPHTADLLKTTSLPFALIISPFAKTIEGEMQPPVVDFGEVGPIRCIRCKAYMSPNMQFIDAGRRFLCVLCKATSEVPAEYFQHLDHTGQRVDKYERPELVLGTYEFVATNDYCRDNLPPIPPAFIFIIDVSYNNVKSGFVHLFCQEIKDILKNLPIDNGKQKSNIKVGFITYNSLVHFYNLKNSLTQPQMMIVGDLQDMFMPLLDGFLCDHEESSTVIDGLMDQIPKMFENTKETETVLYAAVQAGLAALEASKCSGKLFVFNSSLPVAEAPGKLRNREDRKVLGSDKEKSILMPQNSIYDELAQKAVQAACSIDLYIFNNSYVDLATIGQLARITGGEIHKYTYFQADVDGQRLINDIKRNISKPIAFDAVMRVRTSSGVRPTDFYGQFHMSNTTDIELASINCDKGIAIELKHDDKLAPEENVYVQIALLYTSCGGQRRLRIINLALRTTTTIADVFKSCDLDSIILFFAKQSMMKLLELTPKVVKENLIRRSAQILACYRKHCTSPTSAGQLILPECLKLLPLYVSCLLKNDSISGGADMTCDDRSYAINFVLSADLPVSVSYIYPRLLPIHNVNLEETNIPNPLRCTSEKMKEEGAYILENGIYLFIWLGNKLSIDFIQELFGVQSITQINTERFVIAQNTPLSKRISQILNAIMIERRRSMKITLVRQHDKLEHILRHFLIEDRGSDGSSSYVDFLCHMHKEIKDLLN